MAYLWGILLSSTLSAHQVEQFYAEQKDQIITIQFDVAYSMHRTSEDLNAPQPKREWLLKQSSEQHLLLKQEAESYLRKYLSICSEGKPIDFTLHFPDFDTSPPSFISLLNQGAYYRIQLKPKKNTSSPIKPKIIAANSPKLLLTKKSGDDTTYTTYSPPEKDITPISGKGVETNTLIIGFNHVIPDGLDHILFIIGICLSAPCLRQLLWQSLTFTIAHAFSMALIISKTYPIYSYPIASFIEPIIALSISFIAIETIFQRNKHSYRYLIIAVFGLIHGCGFAGSLGSSLQSLNTNEWIIPLIIANVGIELAQAVLLLCSFSLLVLLKNKLEKKKYKILIHSLAITISIVGIIMFFQRL